MGPATTGERSTSSIARPTVLGPATDATPIPTSTSRRSSSPSSTGRRPPETRLARLRRRLAGSNNALGRGLLMLLVPGPDRRADLGGLRGHPHHRRSGGRPDHRAGRQPAHPVPDRGCGRSEQGPRDPAVRAARPGRPQHGPDHPGRPDRDPGGDHGRRRERHRQDHHRRQAGTGAGGRGQGRAARCRRHLPGRGGRPAADLGRPGRRTHRPRRGGGGSGQRRVRGGEGRASRARSTWCSSTPPVGCTPRPG